MPASTTQVPSAKSKYVEFQIGWWAEGFGLAASGLHSLIKQVCKYIDHGHGATDRPFVIYGQSGQATMGLYMGQGLLKQSIFDALKMFQDSLRTLSVSTPSLAMQLCGPGYGSTHIFGIMVTSNGTFASIQDAIKSWTNATCLSFASFLNVTGHAKFITTPELELTNGTSKSKRYHVLHARGECRTLQVEPGNGCADLAVKCGISPADFAKHNSGSKFCSTLRPKQHVCCSSGDLPNFSPKPNADGSCHSYQVQENDNCDDLAAQFSLTRRRLESFNKKTWGWNGCRLLFKDAIICLSKGTPPFPAEIPNAVCGPQKPGSKAPTDGSDISKLNPCPLNACCNIWGQCGITKDFCVDTNTGSPGTARTGTYGCISNCGTDVVRGDGSGAIKIVYFEGYAFGRECLYQDASQINAAAYTHIHFAFGTLTNDYEVEVGDALSSYQFEEFKRIRGTKRILSFGGWDFSTFPATYNIFRQGVTPANRFRMAINIANFIKKHDLDGVDIDWEYPGAPDLPDIPPASLDDGPNYLAFLVILKNLLPGKSVSIAAPSSYWYLKQYPIKAIGSVVDYIVYMTYDLHGQWDADNVYSQEGCVNGNCLRSQVNLTETKQSLAMITKAGVPGRKVVVGITSYGRSFNMAQAGCWGPGCLFTGSRGSSEATKGVCTGTAGYIADAEIEEIIRDESRVVTKFVDASSNSDILVYDNTQYVSYMGAATKRMRTALYAIWGMGGTTDWASDLQEYHDAPKPVANWAIFKEMARSGSDPKSDHSRNGNWTAFDCTHELIDDWPDFTPSERWRGLNADAAWADVKRIWRDTDSKRVGFTFIQSVSATLDIGAMPNCGSLLSSNCAQAAECPAGANGAKSGPAAQLIWNSLVAIHSMHKDYHDTLFKVAGVVSTALKDLENKFAPVPAEEDNKWLLLLIDLVTLGTLSVAGPFFNNFLKKMPYFLKAANDATFNNVKDTTMNLIGQSTTIAKDLLPGSGGGSDWSLEKQDSFSNYMGNTINGWGNVTSLALGKLFNGTDDSLAMLWDAMSDGKLIEGKAFADAPPGNAENELRANIGKSFFGYAIPALWQASGSWAFVIDSGYGCDERDPLDDYLDTKTMEATGSCYDGKRYYLAHPDGMAYTCFEGGCMDNKFSAPPGLDTLDGEIFGGITKDDLIKGSVRTYLHNGRENGGGFADPTNGGTLDGLLAADVTTPGFMRLPVCSPERAFQSWETSTKGSSANYPCDVPPGRDECGDSTFEDQTSGASPSVDDCRQIIRNIEGDGSTSWTTQVVGKRQREIARFGGCSFGVEATKVDGNADFVVGGQDVIDIINDAIARFGGGGKVGAKGEMGCTGSVKKQKVKWGIY